jgi:hypothetical protein
MGLIIGHIDLPSSDTPDNICDPDRDIPWTTLAHTAHAIRGHYTDVELISRPGILLSITRQGVTKHVQDTHIFCSMVAASLYMRTVPPSTTTCAKQQTN